MAKNTVKLPGTEAEPERRVRPQHTSLFKDGKEYPDPTPMAPPIGFIKQPTLAETMRQMILGEALKRHAREQGAETFEEADDFDVGDDFDPSSPYEEVFEPHPEPNPEESYAPIAKAIAKEIRSAFTEERPTEGSSGAPPSEPPPPAARPSEPSTQQQGGASPPPTDPFTGFFKR